MKHRGFYYIIFNMQHQVQLFVLKNELTVIVWNYTSKNLLDPSEKESSVWERKGSILRRGSGMKKNLNDIVLEVSSGKNKSVDAMKLYEKHV